MPPARRMYRVLQAPLRSQQCTIAIVRDFKTDEVLAKAKKFQSLPAARAAAEFRSRNKS